MTAMPSSLIEHAGWVLLHSVWQFAAIALLIFVGNRLLKNASASSRYTLLLSALLLVTIAPVATCFILPKPLEDITVAEVEAMPLLDELSQPDMGAVQLSPAFESTANQPSEIANLPTMPSAVVMEDVSAAPWNERLADVLQPWLSTIVVLWCAGVLLFSVRPISGWLNVRRLRTVGTSPVAESVQVTLQSIAERLDVKRRVEILASTVVSSPIVVGCFRSVILLPASFIANVPTSQLEAILAHELAHVHRYDYLVNLLQTLIETLFFYHPAVWWLSHRIRIERENCCDDLVVATFANKGDYGRALLAVEEFRNTSAAKSSLALGANGGSLLDRVRRLVHPPGQEERAGSDGAVALTILTMTLLAVGFWAAAETQADEESAESIAMPLLTTNDEKTSETSDWVKIVESLKKRRIDPERFTPWQLMNFIDGFGTAAPFQRSADDPEILTVTQWLEESPPYDGDFVWWETDWGARARVDTRPFRSEIRLGQFLAALAEAEVSASQKLTAKGLSGQTTTVTVADVVTDLKRRVTDDQEMAFVLRALIYYLPIDAEWQNQEGEIWNIERLAQTVSDLASSGRFAHHDGTSQLYALAIALDHFRKGNEGRALPPVWKNVEKVVANGLTQVQRRQHPDGWLPSKLDRSGSDSSLSQRLVRTGTSLCFVLAAVPASELNTDWIQRALSSLRNDIEAVRGEHIGTQQVAFAAKAFTLYARKTSGVSLGSAKQSGETDSSKDNHSPLDSYVVRLQDGSSVELVGITNRNEPAIEGWKPNGLRLGKTAANLPGSPNLSGDFDTLSRRPLQEQNSEVRDFIFRLDKLIGQPSVHVELPGRSIDGAELTFFQPSLIRVSDARPVRPQLARVAKPEPGVVSLALTDEAWGKWLRVDANTGAVFNSLTGADLYGRFYERISIVRAQSSPDRQPSGPELVLQHPITHQSEYAIQVRGIDDAGKIITCTSISGDGINKDSRTHRITYSLPTTVYRTERLTRFEYRLRPYRHLVKFENVATEGPRDEPSQVKVSVKQLPNPKPLPDSYVAKLPGGQSIELVGMTSNNEPASEGWKPDGRRLQKGIGKWNPDVHLPEDARDFLFRLYGLKSVPSLRFSLPGYGGHFTFLQQDELLGPWRLRVGGSPGDESRFAGGYFRQEAGVVQVAMTDEPWGEWLQISATDGQILNPLEVAATLKAAYNKIKVRGIAPLPAKNEPRSLSAGPGLTLFRSELHSIKHDFRVRAVDSAGEELRLVLDFGPRDLEKLRTFPEELTWRLYKPLPEGRTLSRFEYRLRPYRHLVTFENVLTDGPSDESSEVKVSAETLPNSEPVEPSQAADVKLDADSHARKIALAAHRKAAAIDTLPRFCIRSDITNRFDNFLPSATDDGVENLKSAFTADVSAGQSWRYFSTFAWDEQRWLKGSQPWGLVKGNQTLASLTQTGSVSWATKEIAVERGSRPGKTARCILLAGSAAMWPHHQLSDPNYLLISRHQFRWGANDGHAQYLAGTSIPPGEADFSMVGEETVDGELCDVIDSMARLERLWISRKTGLIIACVKYSSKFSPDFHKSDVVAEIAGRRFSTHADYVQWRRQTLPQTQSQLTKASAMLVGRRPAVMVRFRDFREVAPGIWWPFVESRVQVRVADKNGRYGFTRGIIKVQSVETDIDLTATTEQLKPRNGDRVQDQRFRDLAVVDYTYREDMTDKEVLQLVDAKAQELKETQEYLSKLLKPFDELIGTPAPELPDDGWVNGHRPPLKGKPYLLHYWATWCGPCKNDLPLLSKLSQQGLQIVGLHPAGTPVAKVQKMIDSEQLGYPTFLASKDNSTGTSIAGLPSGVYPHAILVNAKGKVIAHGRLEERNFRLVSMLRESTKQTNTNAAAAVSER